MNRSDFLKLMENRSSIDPKMTTEVGEIISIFPYFQSAHLLLLKGLHDNGDVRFGNQLRTSAIHLADREILYDLLYKTPELPDTENISVQVTVNALAGIPDSELNSLDLVDDADQTPELLELDLDKNGIIDDPVMADEEITQQEPANLSQSDLIDRFIIANPRIEPNREKKDVPAEDLSVPMSGEGGFITETLAKIYISQGYYSKAIDIFEKLSLKYPEKSSYFATQIEKVKEYLKK